MNTLIILLIIAMAILTIGAIKFLIEFFKLIDVIHDFRIQKFKEEDSK